jgi:hypothetical protein
LVGVLVLFFFFQNFVFLRNPMFCLLFLMKLGTFNNRRKPWSLGLRVFSNSSKHCDLHQHLAPVQVTARQDFAQVVPYREHPVLNLKNQGVLTWKFSVGDVTNSWQQCICPLLMGVNPNV